MRTHRSVVTLADTPLRYWDRENAATWRASWSRFVRTCESLARDGFEYSVSVTVADVRQTPYLTVTLQGTAAGRLAPAKAERKSRKFHMPAMLTVEQCQKRARSAVNQIGIDGDHYARMLRHETPEWRTFDALLRAAVNVGSIGPGERTELREAWANVADPEWYGGQEITRELERGNLNYLLFRLCQQDTPYRGMKCCNPGDYFRQHDINVEAARKWFTRDTSIEDSERRAAREYQETAGELVSAELEFWEEMESLSGQRQHNKPGIVAAEPIYDDAVAA